MTVIWFFGGYKATWADVNLWKASALHQKPDLAISVFPYPKDSSASALAAIAGFEKEEGIEQQIDYLEKYKEKVFLV